MKPIFYASKIASYIGENPYESIDTCLDKLRYTYLRKLGYPVVSPTPKEDYLEKYYSYQLNNVPKENIPLKIKEISDLIQTSTLDRDEQQFHIKIVNSCGNRIIGQRSEMDIIHLIEDKFNITITENNMKLYCKPFENFTISGKCDGFIYQDNNIRILVEIKNRINKLSGRVPPYEYVQLQMLMLLTDTTQAILYEYYDHNILSYTININQDFINKVIQYLNIIALFLPLEETIFTSYKCQYISCII